MPRNESGANTRQRYKTGRLILTLDGREVTAAPVTLDPSKLGDAAKHLRDLFAALEFQGKTGIRFEAQS